MAFGLPQWLSSKESAYNAGDTGLVPGSGGSPGGGDGNPLQCSCLENPMNRGAWWAIVRRRKELFMTEEILNTYIQMEEVQWMPHTRTRK